MTKHTGPTQTDAVASDTFFQEALSSIAGEFEILCGSTEKIKTICCEIRKKLGTSPSQSDLEQVKTFLPLLKKKLGEINQPLFDFFDELVQNLERPWPFLRGMLEARDSSLVNQALDRLKQFAASKKIPIDIEIAHTLSKLDTPASSTDETTRLEILAEILAYFPTSSAGSTIEVLTFLYQQEEHTSVRQLAARILDLAKEPPSTTVAESVLGEEAYTFFAPYLAFTRASYLDLLYLSPISQDTPPSLESLQMAEQGCGSELLRKVISQLGWSKLNLGLVAQRYLSVSIDGSFPFLVSPEEAELLDPSKSTRQSTEHWLFTAHGRPEIAENKEVKADGNRMSRFRSYNLTHAEVLGEILDVAPLCREKVESIISHMDKIVEDYIYLFSKESDECAILGDIYEDLRQRIRAELEKEASQPQLSVPLTQLVQLFEDPTSVTEVQTLHGLKRYLHQEGLVLGLRFVGSGSATERTVSLAHISATNEFFLTECVRYSDFEPRNQASPSEVPFAVRLLVEGFARQMLYHKTKFPRVAVFCYGNEVHYYISFANHPVFLRIDFSPPLRGGMIHLKYYGVSKYELELHPNITLDAIKLFFRKLEYECEIHNTHIIARYDKERAIDLGEICDKAKALFRLVPYLMEIDWVIGFLELSPDSRNRVIEAWSDFFALWGALPIEQWLTEDRTGICIASETGPEGKREIRWSGEGDYQDRFALLKKGELFQKVKSSLSQLPLKYRLFLEAAEDTAIGQLGLEKFVLNPLRKALDHGVLVNTEHGLEKQSEDLFQEEHEARRFAEILSGDDYTLASTICLAKLIAPFEQTLRFRTSAMLNGYTIEQATLHLSEEKLGLYVLRDSQSMVELAFFSRPEMLCRRRANTSLPWQSSSRVDPSDFLLLLRANNYPTPSAISVVEIDDAVLQKVREKYQRTSFKQNIPPLPGERLLKGRKASPGRSVGKVVLGTSGRNLNDLHATILVTPSVQPQDNPILIHSAGIVSTGGGILSHAGLTARQFHIPALFVSGTWRESENGSPELLYTTLEYSEERTEYSGFELSVRVRFKKTEHVLNGGELVVLDAERGLLSVLGKSQEALTLHENLRLLESTNRSLAQSNDEREMLSLRGKRLRARHKIGKVLHSLSEPVLARYAIDEILLGRRFIEHGGKQSEKARLLKMLLENPLANETTRSWLKHTIDELRGRCRNLKDELTLRIQHSEESYEILSLRLEFIRLLLMQESAATALLECGIEQSAPEGTLIHDLDSLIISRLQLLKTEKEKKLNEYSSVPEKRARLRHLLHQIDRLNLVTKRVGENGEYLASFRNDLDTSDQREVISAGHRLVLEQSDISFAHAKLVGWKAANLAEIARLGYPESVPPWFVLSNHAFEQVLELYPKKEIEGAQRALLNPTSIRDGIAKILKNEEFTSKEKSKRIRLLWDNIELPQELKQEICSAYRNLFYEKDASTDNGYGPLVAVRSSAYEEDSEVNAFAGGFDTFLFVRGEEQLVHYVKRAWSGLWTERAIDARRMLEPGLSQPEGGIVVQRNIFSRVSGVLQTVNIPENNLREIVINAGLGLGEGVVSGQVNVDQIAISKDGYSENVPLRIRYLTADKPQQVVFDTDSGCGTVLKETPYHQRLRPVLEYSELCVLVRTALLLEKDYGYPLDIEFGIEKTKLWILQVRPVTDFSSVLMRTQERYPLGGNCY